MNEKTGKKCRIKSFQTLEMNGRLVDIQVALIKQKWLKLCKATPPYQKNIDKKEIDSHMHTYKYESLCFTCETITTLLIDYNAK